MGTRQDKVVLIRIKNVIHLLFIIKMLDIG
jgi:hypothetical protein